MPVSEHVIPYAREFLLYFHIRYTCF